MAGASRSAEEIRRVEAALARYSLRMGEIETQWAADGGVCCPSCYSGEFRELDAKVGRVKAWLSVLISRRARSALPPR